MRNLSRFHRRPSCRPGGSPPPGGGGLLQLSGVSGGSRRSGENQTRRRRRWRRDTLYGWLGTKPGLLTLSLLRSLAGRLACGGRINRRADVSSLPSSGKRVVWNRLRLLSADTRSVLQVLTRRQMGRAAPPGARWQEWMDGNLIFFYLVNSQPDARSRGRLAALGCQKLHWRYFSVSEGGTFCLFAST